MARELIVNVSVVEDDLIFLASEGEEIVEFAKRKLPQVNFDGMFFHSWHLEIDGSYTFLFGDEAALLTW